MSTPAPAGTYHDGDILWDGIEISIGGKTFIFEDFSPMEESATDVSNNVNTVPRGARHRRTLISFNGKAQFPLGSTLADKPALFTTFTAPYGGVMKNWILTGVGTPMLVGQETRCAVKITELINAPINAPAA